MNFKSTLNQLRLFATLEGISYLLFGLTMPLKYLYDIKGPNYFVGMAHGVLFIAYCLWSVIVAKEEKLGLKNTFILLIASLLPFATFIVDAKLLKPLQEKSKK